MDEFHPHRYRYRLLMVTSSSGASEIWSALSRIRNGEPFDPDDIVDLPAPARRYLLHAIRPGTPLGGHVHLRMHGHMRLRPGSSLLPMEAEQIIAPAHGFVWRATVSPWYLRFVGHDSYANGQGHMLWKLWDMLTVVRASGPDISRSAADRLAIESIFLPSSLVPGPGVSWEAVDDSTARVWIKIDNDPHAVDLAIDDSGRLVQARMLRWGDHNPEKKYGMDSFGTFSINNERTFGSFTIPSCFSVGWRPGADNPFEFLFAEIDNAEFG